MPLDTGTRLGRYAPLLLVVLGLAVLTPAGLYLLNAHRLDLDRFDRQADLLLERSRDLVERAAAGEFEEDRLVEALGRHPFNGPGTRLDERLDLVVAEDLDPTKETSTPPAGSTSPVLREHLRHGALRIRATGEVDANQYRLEPFGASYAEVDGELRRVLYVGTSRALEYRVDVPAGSPELSFGLGILEPGDPVLFTVLVDGETIASRTVEAPDDWVDTTLDLSPWAGRRVEIRLETRSEGSNVGFWSSPLLAGPPTERLNVVLLLEDTLRADRLSLYGSPRPTSPVKDEFFRDGIRFRRAVAQATKTRPSVPSLLTGLYPSATGVWNFADKLSDLYLTLPEVFRHQGFATASFVQNDNAGPRAGLHQGFDRLFDPGRAGKRAETLYGPDLRDWLTEHAERNFFLYLHLIDPHGPYDPPPEFRSWLGTSGAERTDPVEADPQFDPPWVRAPDRSTRSDLYDGEIAYNDSWFARFLVLLEEAGVRDSTLIVFVSDHGEYLGEHGGRWGHEPPGHLQGLHVPLAFHHPGLLPRGGEVEEAVQLVDVVPTILELTGIEATDLLPLQGESLLPLPGPAGSTPPRNGRLVVSEEVVLADKKGDHARGSFFFGRWHLLSTDLHADPPARALRRLSPWLAERVFTIRAWDLEADPTEESPLRSVWADLLLARRIRAVARELRSQGSTFWKLTTFGTEAATVYDRDEVERLRSLGYLE